MLSTAISASCFLYNKKRPVLVISNTPYNTLTEDIVVCAITSNLSDKYYTVRFDNSNMKEGNLKF